MVAMTNSIVSSSTKQPPRYAVRARWNFSTPVLLICSWKPVHHPGNHSEPIWRDLTEKRCISPAAVAALFDGASPHGAKDHNPSGLWLHNYELPNTIAHNETCANIGNVLWNWRGSRHGCCASYGCRRTRALQQYYRVATLRWDEFLRQPAPHHRSTSHRAPFSTSTRALRQFCSAVRRTRPHHCHSAQFAYAKFNTATPMLAQTNVATRVPPPRPPHSRPPYGGSV